jgi:hypothetical protein
VQVLFALLVLFAAPFLPGIFSFIVLSFLGLTYFPRIAPMAHRKRQRRSCLCACQEAAFYRGEHRLY